MSSKVPSSVASQTISGRQGVSQSRSGTITEPTGSATELRQIKKAVLAILAPAGYDLLYFTARGPGAPALAVYKKVRTPTEARKERARLDKVIFVTLPSPVPARGQCMQQEPSFGRQSPR
jgi:hypothetical protein